MKLLGIEEALENNPFLTTRVLNHMPRWSTVPVLHRQTVGAHSFLVARYCMILLDMISADMNIAAVLILALTHDDEELKIGDLPSPSKDDTNGDMPTIEHGLVKVADRLEAYTYTSEEVAFGNTIVIPFVNQTWGRYIETRRLFFDKFDVRVRPKFMDHPFMRDLDD
jgi:5'-deoxynucleotidase YfbR-like HD superfamily hydrolase